VDPATGRVYSLLFPRGWPAPLTLPGYVLSVVPLVLLADA
jgi:hypothetical protein